MITLEHISDTHLQPFPELKGADILVHSGDALNYGSIDELAKFRKQLEPIHHKYQHILYVPGNHDWAFEHNYNIAQEFLYETIPNILVLHNQEWKHPTLPYKFYGTSDQPEFCNWAFNRNPEELTNSYSKIPDDTDILITHCPPHGILDYTMRGEHVGSKELQFELFRLKNLKAHLFGHIHYSYGQIELNGVKYSNGATCGENYRPINEPRIIELV
jgi:Icc-related predicted phosphoesterase